MRIIKALGIFLLMVFLGSLVKAMLQTYNGPGYYSWVDYAVILITVLLLKKVGVFDKKKVKEEEHGES